MTPNRIHSLCAVLLLIVLSACVRAPAEQSPAPANAEDERAEAARAVDGLAKAYQATADAMEAGPVTLRHVESACFWSERLMAAQGHVADLRVAGLLAGWDRNEEMERELDKVFDAHVARLEHVEQLVQARAAAGDAPPVAVAAARSLVVLARRSRTSFRHALHAHQERELELVFPEIVQETPPISRPRELFIKVDAEGSYHVAGEQVTFEELQSILNVAYINNPGRASVVIRADRRAQWNSVVAAMNACNQARIRDYRVTTSLPADESPDD